MGSKHNFSYTIMLVSLHPLVAKILIRPLLLMNLCINVKLLVDGLRTNIQIASTFHFQLPCYLFRTPARFELEDDILL